MSIPIRLLLLLALSLLPPVSAAALPFGNLGAEDSVLRVTQSSSSFEGCGTGGGVVCGEAVGVLPLADYAAATYPQVFASGSVDHGTGTLAGFIETIYTLPFGPSVASLELNSRDDFTVTGPVAGEAISITAHLLVEGVANVQNNNARANANALIGVGPGSWSPLGGILNADAGAVVNNGFIVNAPGLYSMDTEVVHTFEVVVGTSFELVTYLKVDAAAYQAGSTSIDLLNTATLSFDLPAGYGISSALGFGVPEPSTWVLLTGSLAGLALVGRRSRRA